MGITLANFQLKAIEALMEAMGEPNRDIILKSCTGSGKTIILTHFMDEYLKSTNKAVFVWLTPGKGNLELQSKAKMDKYIHGSNSKLLSDIMSSGFEENDACFINWEKLTKKGNNALKDSERTNFVEHIQNAIDNGLTFTIILIGIALIRPIIPLQALKYVAAVCIFAIMHILGVLLESVAQMYLTFWRNR